MIEINIMVYDLDLSNPTSVVRLLRGRMIASWRWCSLWQFFALFAGRIRQSFYVVLGPRSTLTLFLKMLQLLAWSCKTGSRHWVFQCNWNSQKCLLAASCVIFGDACNYTVRLLLVRPFLFCGVFFCWSVFKICFVTNITAVWKRKPLLLPSRAYQHRSPDDESDDDDNEEDFMNRTFELECGSDISNEN
jgi:hypothetical protein